MQLKVYRKGNRKRDGRNGSRLLLCCCASVIFSLLVVALYRWSGPVTAVAASVRDFFFANAYFSVREIQVRGGERVSGNEIVTMAGLRHGMNLWKIEPTEIEKKVARHPWVRRVLVRREFPRRVIIDVEERIPKAVVALGKLYYVDSDGVVFKEVGAGDYVQFPLLTGLRAEDLTKPDRSLRARIQEAIRFGELMAKDSHILSEIHFAAPDRLVLYTTEFPVALHMGWGDWDDKVKRLDRLLALWKGNEERLVSLDMSYRDQVVARLRRVHQ